MADALSEIERVHHEARAELAAVATPEELEQFRIKYLGSKGAFKGLMQLLGQVPKEQKPAVGQKVNSARAEIDEAFEGKKVSITGIATAEFSTHGGLRSGFEHAVASGTDITEPGLRPHLGRRHILMQVVDELTELFGRMGFSTATGPEVEDEFHNFVALNIPEQHPARDPLDNFYLATGGSGLREAQPQAQGSVNTNAPNTSSPLSPEPRAPENKGDTILYIKGRVPLNSPPEPRTLNPDHSRLLRTQTSTVQIRVMETQKPPIRVVIPGRVYRPDTHDMTHLSMFHQLEALVVDKNVTMVDLKSTILQFVHAYFGVETKVRFRPSFFPFTEPSAEVDVWFEDKQRWIELGGCGMVHPNVFRACNIDPEFYTGWAFGFGIERIAMRKYAINDIRLFVENDVRFLSQF
jgi:phenylalanyl-tRNA synthetase alpha chain